MYNETAVTVRNRTYVRGIFWFPRPCTGLLHKLFVFHTVLGDIFKRISRAVTT